MVTTRSRSTAPALSGPGQGCLLPLSRADLTAIVKRDLVAVAGQPDSALPSSGGRQEDLAGELLQRDRPAYAAGNIRKKVKAIRCQPSIAAEDLARLQAKASRIYDQLLELFVDPPCPLDHNTSFQLLVSVILSAQVQMFYSNQHLRVLIACHRLGRIVDSPASQVYFAVSRSPSPADNRQEGQRSHAIAVQAGSRRTRHGQARGDGPCTARCLLRRRLVATSVQQCCLGAVSLYLVGPAVQMCFAALAAEWCQCRSPR